MASDDQTQATEEGGSVMQLSATFNDKVSQFMEGSMLDEDRHVFNTFIVREEHKELFMKHFQDSESKFTWQAKVVLLLEPPQ